MTSLEENWEQINYSLSNELVSTDIVGNNAPAVYDSPATISSKDGKSIVLYVGMIMNMAIQDK